MAEGSMTALYALAAEYQQTALQLSELDLDAQTISDTLEGMSGELEHKAQNVALMVRHFEANATAIKQWAKDASDRAKATEARAEQLRDYLARCLEAAGIEKVEGPGVVIGWRKSYAVVIDEPDLIPVEFMRVKPAPPPEPDKTAIAAAIKAGKEVAGAHAEQRKNLQIK